MQKVIKRTRVRLITFCIHIYSLLDGIGQLNELLEPISFTFADDFNFDCGTSLSEHITGRSVSKLHKYMV